MKKLYFFALLFFLPYCGFSQSYVPMPVDSAVWRYRFYDIDFITQVFDCILFLNGTDTFAHGNTYHKIISRTYKRVVPNDSIPPVTDEISSYSDIDYGGIRESGKKVYLLTLSGEDLIFDFNVVVGDSIPAYNGKKKVIAIDSVLVSSTYRKRILTTDPAYYAIEGVGSSQGLIPGINDGFGTTQFMCFTHNTEIYTPDIGIPCTYVYPIGYESVSNVLSAASGDVSIFPSPAYDVLHITNVESSVYGIIQNSSGQLVWRGCLAANNTDIAVYLWPKGIYIARLTMRNGIHVIKKILIQ